MGQGTFLTEPEPLPRLFPPPRPKIGGPSSLFPSLNQSPPPRRAPRPRRRPTQRRAEDDPLIELASEIREHDLDCWLRSTARFPETRWSVRERRSLRSWFDQLDEDGSGEIDVDELADPLLSLGIVGTMAEVREIMRAVDDDGSGSLGFAEFLSIMRPRDRDGGRAGDTDVKLPAVRPRRKRKKTDPWVDPGDMCSWNDDVVGRRKEQRGGGRNQNPIARLLEIQKHGDMDLKSIIVLERRKLLLDATVGEAQRRDRALSDISRWKAEIRELHGRSKRDRLRELMYQKKLVRQRMDRAEREKHHFITAIEQIILRALENDIEEC